jgi:hypothetical protein
MAGRVNFTYWMSGMACELPRNNPFDLLSWSVRLLVPVFCDEIDPLNNNAVLRRANEIPPAR